MNNYTFTLHPIAKAEFFDIVDYYHQINVSLAKIFAREFHKTVKWILEFSEAGSPHLYGTRRVKIHRFPYDIVYKVHSNKVIFAYAIAHHRRKPGYWKKRL
jgi:addiction module RelE/StbE family toxin